MSAKISKCIICKHATHCIDVNILAIDDFTGNLDLKNIDLKNCHTPPISCTYVHALNVAIHECFVSCTNVLETGVIVTELLEFQKRTKYA